ncbi:Transposase IS200 like [Enhydrobacter aerosaccus]|uniref:Transposase IS200 like n=1 Tax=Enhydrobacter aerosaccus TaxID=225324 RepID=A0A1T4TC76_9HYPH|nr:transposase [Enhydrobacter aerosaccus]SKA38160.1 Transposase IS200 like [Enhydrobacter aerosaccus]
MANKGWHSRNYLPHFDSPEVTQFVTFRLADSLPRQVLDRLQRAERPETLRHAFLDQGLGACWLRSESVARLVEGALLQFDEIRYHLHAWTIMPNHVHVLFSMKNDASLGTIVGSWKRFTARKANERIGRTGIFWQTEYWDRFIRNKAHFHAAEHYIDDNPVKAGLVAEAHLWPYGSARFKGT